MEIYLPPRFNMNGDLSFDLEPYTLDDAENMLRLYGYSRLHPDIFQALKEDRDILIQKRERGLPVINKFSGLKSVVFVFQMITTERIVARGILPFSDDIENMNNETYESGFYMAQFD